MSKPINEILSVGTADDGLPRFGNVLIVRMPDGSFAHAPTIVYGDWEAGHDDFEDVFAVFPVNTRIVMLYGARVEWDFECDEDGHMAREYLVLSYVKAEVME